MSAGEITDKLGAFLAAHEFFEEECHAVYLMVEMRKVIDQQDLRAKLPILKFYADWTLHSKKDHVTAGIKRIAFEIRECISKPVAGTGSRGTQEIPPLIAFLQMDHLRNEMQLYLESFSLPTYLTRETYRWERFVFLLTNILGDQPIVDPVPGISEIVFSRGGGTCIVKLSKQISGQDSYTQKTR